MNPAAPGAGRASGTSAPPLDVARLIRVPAVLTLAVTLLRLVGELQGRSPALFSRAQGGFFYSECFVGNCVCGVVNN